VRFAPFNLHLFKGFNLQLFKPFHLQFNLLDSASSLLISSSSRALIEWPSAIWLAKWQQARRSQPEAIGECHWALGGSGSRPLGRLIDRLAAGVLPEESWPDAGELGGA